MRYNEIETRLSEISDLLETNITDGELAELEQEVKDLKEEKRQLKQAAETRKNNAAAVANGAGTKANWFNPPEERSKEKMNNENVKIEEQELEIRSLQKYVTGQFKSMTEVEQRALATSGAAAVMPVSVMNTLISNEKYSDLLHRATIINEGGAASVYVPIASNTAASWKVENSDVDGSSNSYEASPTLTKLELKGYELYRWMRLSAATHSMSTGNFTDHMLNLLSGEVIETLEKSFIDGSGTGQPKGLDNLTWGATNSVTTTNASTPIAAADIAEGLSLLPQKYARGAVIMCNADTLYNTISLLKGTSEYAFSMSDGAQRFLSKEIIVNEHIADDVIYIVDPKELYVRFAAPIAVEANTSSGFTAAAIDLRALTVVDAAWNPTACIKVTVGA